MADAKAKEFKVVVEGLGLRSKQADALNKGVQSAVLAEIARLDLYQDFRVRFPRDWLGIWIEPRIGP
jgi:hypothetical protein